MCSESRQTASGLRSRWSRRRRIAIGASRGAVADLRSLSSPSDHNQQQKSEPTTKQKETNENKQNNIQNRSANEVSGATGGTHGGFRAPWRMGCRFRAVQGERRGRNCQCLTRSGRSPGDGDCGG